MVNLSPPRIFTVTEISRSIQGLLEINFPFVSVAGEISNLRQPLSGHVYFTLKDKNAQIRSVIFKPQLRYLAADKIMAGEHVICRGRISVYEPRGEYQLVVDHLEAQGSGTLQLAFESLKRQLASEGLFDEARKKKLPLLPNRVALITAAGGAALFDFLKIAAQRSPGTPLEIFPVRVQGPNAATEIIEALEILNKRKTSDVIVLTRGGGSLEDLWTFNEEGVARAIHASSIPVISAIGHEVDFTIADFVADLRAPTPTAAAEMCIPDRHKILTQVSTHRRRISERIARLIKEHQRLVLLQLRILGNPRSMLTHFLLRVDTAQTTLLHHLVNTLHTRRISLKKTERRLHESNPAQRLAYNKKWSLELKRQLAVQLRSGLDRKRASLKRTLCLLESVNPQNVLRRGYAIVRTTGQGGGEIIRSSLQTDRGQNIAVLLGDGELGCEVKEIMPPHARPSADNN